ncbi:hypothetical protein Misp05_12230 [Micromonospora sp. NBRC 107095]|nr:hypothetical protein Misp05_12230 [Micromonospora sp. NBRC 107095]
MIGAAAPSPKMGWTNISACLLRLLLVTQWGANLLPSRLDKGDRLLEALVLPNAGDAPPIRYKCGRDGEIPVYVALEFDRPVTGGVGGSPTMLRAAVPEASVDKHGELALGVDKIRTYPPPRRDDRQRYPIAVPESMKSSAKA